MKNAHSKPAVVFIVAHPDDIAIQMGGTALLLKERYKLHVLCASKGERGYAWKGKGLCPLNFELAAIREKEEAAACAMLDAELTFLDQPDGEIFADRAVCGKVAVMLAPLKPVAVFTMCPMEKPDHSAAYEIALQALHLSGLFWTTELYMSLFPGEFFNAKFADLYVNISSVIEQKIELCRCHASQCKNEGIGRFINNCNTFLGKLAWCDHAEAFMTGLPLMGTRWKRKAGSILLEHMA